MSSILDAVTKDAARSGNIPAAPGGAAPHGPDAPGGGSGLSRFRSAVLVVVLGVALGAAAARMFGGGEPEADDMLTDKASRRANAERKDDVAAAPATPEPKGSNRDEAAHARFVAKKKEAAAAAAPTAVATPPAPQPLVIPAPAVAPSAPAPAPPLVASAPVATPVASPLISRPSVVAGTPVVPPVPPAPGSPPSVVAGTPAAPQAPPAVALPPIVVASPAVALPPIVAPSPVVAAPLPPAAVATAPAAPVPSIVTGASPGSPPATLEVPADPARANDDGLASAEEGAAGAPPADTVLDTMPAGAPAVSILFVAWSRTPTDRMASMRVGSGSLSVVHEGEYVEGLQVSAIHPEAVEFQWTGQRFRVPVRPF